jgi:hypothetical protein
MLFVDKQSQTLYLFELNEFRPVANKECLALVGICVI